MEHASNLNLYITSVYWVVSTLTTVGFGDIHAYNDGNILFSKLFVTTNNIAERGITIFWIIIGVGFYSLNIGTMTSLLANTDSKYILL